MGASSFPLNILIIRNMITVKFPYNTINDFYAPVNGVTLIANRPNNVDGQNMLLDMFHAFYGILNYDKLCYETFLADVASIDNLPLNFSSKEDLLYSLPKMGDNQLKSIGVYFKHLKNCVQKRTVGNLAFLMSSRFNLERNLFGKMRIDEGIHTVLDTNLNSEFQKPKGINSVFYLDCKNGTGRIHDFDIEVAKPKGELEELLDFIEPYFGRIPSQSTIDTLGQLYERIWRGKLDSKTLVFIDNMDIGLGLIEAFDFENILIRIHRVTGAKFVITEHHCINLDNGWLIKDCCEDYPFCVTLSK